MVETQNGDTDKKIPQQIKVVGHEELYKHTRTSNGSILNAINDYPTRIYFWKATIEEE